MDRESHIERPVDAEASATGPGEVAASGAGCRDIEAQVRQLLEVLPVMIGAASPADQLKDLNCQIPDIRRKHAVQVIGAKWRGSLHPNDAGRALKESARRSAAGLPIWYCLTALNSCIAALAAAKVCSSSVLTRTQCAGRRLTERLSARECAVLALIAQGQSNKCVARTLSITPETVKSHVKRAFEKLGARTRAEAVARATELGALPDAALSPGSSRGSRSSLHRPHEPTLGDPARTQRSSFLEYDERALGGAA